MKRHFDVEDLTVVYLLADYLHNNKTKDLTPFLDYLYEFDLIGGKTGKSKISLYKRLIKKNGDYKRASYKDKSFYLLINKHLDVIKPLNLNNSSVEIFFSRLDMAENLLFSKVTACGLYEQMENIKKSTNPSLKLKRFVDLFIISEFNNTGLRDKSDKKRLVGLYIENYKDEGMTQTVFSNLLKVKINIEKDCKLVKKDEQELYKKTTYLIDKYSKKINLYMKPWLVKSIPELLEDIDNVSYGIIKIIEKKEKLLT